MCDLQLIVRNLVRWILAARKNNSVLSTLSLGFLIMLSREVRRYSTNNDVLTSEERKRSLSGAGLGMGSRGQVHKVQ